MAINILHFSGIKMTWTGEAFWKANQTSHYFKGKNSVLIFSLTSALSLWQILEIILGLKIWIEKPCFRNLLLPSGREANCEKKNGDVAGSCWPKSYCSGVTVIVGLDYWHDFPSSLLPTSSKSPLCPSGVHTDLLRDRLAGTGQAAVSLCGLCLTWVTWEFRSYCLCAAVPKDVLSHVFLNCFPTMSL